MLDFFTPNVEVREKGENNEKESIRKETCRKLIFQEGASK
jgi:hypothetical protein